MNDTLQQLNEILLQRQDADPAKSYVAALYNKGLEAILKKVGEETVETIMAAKDGDQKHLVHEIADLWFHTMVLLRYHDTDVDQVLKELTRRFGQSGLDEKAARKNVTQEH